MTGGGLTIFTKRFLEDSLWAYGEDDLLLLVEHGLTKDQVRAIGVRDAQLTYESDLSSKVGNSYRSDKALAIAVVEVLNASPRQLTRKRRRSSPPME